MEAEDLLTIPDFLRREPEPAKKVRITRRKKIRGPKIPPPWKVKKAKQWKKAKPWLVKTDGETPHIGSGRRVMWAVLGRKWAYLYSGYGCTQRIDLRTWERLPKTAL